MNYFIQISILFLIFTSNYSHADYYDNSTHYDYSDNFYDQDFFIIDRSSCTKEYYTLEGIERTVGRTCTLSQELRLSTTNKYYPKLNSNPRTVQYWQGAYEKEVRTTRHYTRELVNVCDGEIISTRPHVRTSTETRVFKVRNPNLSDAISESFMLVPMTRAEAERELSEQRINCQNYRIDD